MKSTETTDLSGAVEIADRTWWVGHHIPGDPFQCHVYLIENGDQSVLIDPGSLLTFDRTRRKIEQVVPLDDIRYFVCHHQDPDVAGAMTRLDPLITRPDAVLITHWRARALLRHMGLAIPMWLVEEHDWKLELPDRTLQFVFTPYMHFPGAYCTFDTKTGVLFSSDIFGGYTDSPKLYAEDESHFEAIRPFHEHYMPSNEVVVHGMSRLEKLPIQLIAPQHGLLIPERLVDYMIQRLKSLDCGLYLLTVHDTDIERLLQLSRVLREVLRTLVLHRDLSAIASGLTEIIARVLPVTGVEAWVTDETGATLAFAPESGYRGVAATPPPICQSMMDGGPHAPKTLVLTPVDITWGRADLEAPWRLVIGLSTEHDVSEMRSCVAFRLTEPVRMTDEIKGALSRIREPLAVALEREAVLRRVDGERRQAVERSTRDPLTGLYNRAYMQTTVSRLIEIHERNPLAMVSVALLDIDHFKTVNDTAGHIAGDEVLRKVATSIIAASREADIAVRLGGEEFALFVAGDVTAAHHVAERVRQAVSSLRFEGTMADRTITMSAGVAQRSAGQDLDTLIARADEGLYKAKRAGRDRTVIMP